MNKNPLPLSSAVDVRRPQSFVMRPGPDPTSEARHASAVSLPPGRGQPARAAVRHLPADATTNDGQTALMLAARNGDLCIMDLLIRSGVQIDKQDAQGETALMKAAYHGHVMAVDLLLARGADAGLRSLAGHTALDMARKGAECGRHAQVIESLRAASAAD